MTTHAKSTLTVSPIQAEELRVRGRLLDALVPKLMGRIESLEANARLLQQSHDQARSNATQLQHDLAAERKKQEARIDCILSLQSTSSNNESTAMPAANDDGRSIGGVISQLIPTPTLATSIKTKSWAGIVLSCASLMSAGFAMLFAAMSIQPFAEVKSFEWIMALVGAAMAIGASFLILWLSIAGDWKWNRPVAIAVFAALAFAVCSIISSATMVTPKENPQDAAASYWHSLIMLWDGIVKSFHPYRFTSCFCFVASMFLMTVQIKLVPMPRARLTGRNDAGDTSERHVTFILIVIALSCIVNTYAFLMIAPVNGDALGVILLLFGVAIGAFFSVKNPSGSSREFGVRTDSPVRGAPPNA